MKQNYTYEQLLEKIIRAKIKLEQAPRSSSQHSVSCPMEDPENYAPCNCGASTNNSHIDGALKELEL